MNQPATPIQDSLQTEIAVIGAGPAGIAAATAAARHSGHVLLLDDNPAPGGQIWRASIAANKSDTPKDRALAALAQSGASVLAGHQVFQAPQPFHLHALEAATGRVLQIQYRRLILATGARERFLPFPGWTLPGVFGAGGLDALVKAGFSVAGKRIVVAGSGPLLLAVAAHLQSQGAAIALIAEQAPTTQLAAFAASLLARPAKLRQGAKYRLTLANTPYKIGCWPMEAIPAANSAANPAQLQSVRLTNGTRTWHEPCDLLACGFHLIPNTELASLLGCALTNGFVQVDSEQRTSIPHIFAAGEPTGIAGIDAALLQGQIAGLASTSQPTQILQRRAAREKSFAASLQKAFTLRPELKTLANPQTILCRCEDVPWHAVAAAQSSTQAKILARCAMGPCQGRICSPILSFLFDWQPPSVRPPIFPVPVHALCTHPQDLEPTPIQETA